MNNLIKHSAWTSRTSILLLYAPLFNWAFFSLSLTNIQKFSWQLSSEIAFVHFVTGLLCWLFILLIDRQDFKTKRNTAFFMGRYILATTIGGLVAFKMTFYMGFNQTPENVVPILPFVMAWLEVALFAAIRHILLQNQQQLVLQKNYKAAQYSALKAQLNPHFLFNTLNLLSCEIENNPEKALDILDELAGLLRRVLHSSSKPNVTLELELELIRHYLALQEMRFEDNLNYKILLDDDCLPVQVPSLILQPIVENCFIHGFKNNLVSAEITISIKQQGPSLFISVKDNGCGFDTSKKVSGHGMALVRDTLALLYSGHPKDSASLQIQSQQGSGTEVIIKLPVITGSQM